MTPSLDNKFYTIRFTCNYATTIPCHPKSEDVGQTYTIDKPCPQCLPHPYLVKAIFDRAHFEEVQALKKARGEAREPTSGDINQCLSTKLQRIDDDSKSISGGSVRSTSSDRHFVKSSFQILKSVVTRPRRKKIPAPAVEIIITPPEEDVSPEENVDRHATAGLVSRDSVSSSTMNQWESFLKKANEIQSAEQDNDEEKKRKEVEHRLEEAEREVVLEKMKAVELSLEQLA